MSWIHSISFEDATGNLKKLYSRIAGPGNTLDNILQVHSLRPHTLKGHMALYKNVLHHSENTLPKWLLETLGVYVSLLNNCAYCVDHHFAGLQRLLKDDGRAHEIMLALKSGRLTGTFEGRELALLLYAQQLTLQPDQLDSATARKLRSEGLDDGEILEANQVISYFAYANRTVLGLGVTTHGDILGTSPGTGGEDEWGHG